MLIERISSEELGMMDTWRRWNAWNEESTNRRGHYTPMASILHEWDIRKSEYLAKMFGDTLMMTKHIDYNKSYEELQNELSDMMRPSGSCGRAGRNGYDFYRNWNEYVYRTCHHFNDSQLDGLSRLMSDECLINNTYDGPSFEIIKRDGKPFRVNRGCKTSKTLGKLADIFDIPGWEDFRICHSQILNQKALGGKLTISIHPLDYMTMSDNSYGWESCMSWEKEGGYRQGTVEMMNSRCVVIAYLAGDDQMRIGDDYWNSKKWRQLFIVDHNLIAGVKDYPYHNETLGLEVVKWLKELAGEKLGWHYENIIPYGFDGKKIHLDYLPEEKNDFSLDIATGAMYNDFGCLDYHWMCFSTDINPDELRGSSGSDWRNIYLPVYYSGTPQCMICGELDPDFEDESCLACQECQERQRCDCCGEIASEVWSIDGMQLCEYCWENRVHECAACGREHYDEIMRPIFVIPRLSAEMEESYRKDWIKNGHYWSCGFAQTKTDLETAEYNFFNDDNPNGWICDDDRCFEKFIEKFLKPGERPHLREWRWTKETCVYLDQLNDDGIDEFAWGFKDDNDGYINSFRTHHCQPTRFIELL